MKGSASASAESASSARSPSLLRFQSGREFLQRRKVPLTGNQLEVVVVCAINPQRHLRSLRFFVELKSMVEGDDFIGSPVHEEDGRAHLFDLVDVAKSIEGNQRHFGEHPKRSSEAALYDESSHRPARRQVNRGPGSDGAPKGNNSFRRYLKRLGQVLVGGINVGVDCLFCRRAFAGAITVVVIREYREANGAELLKKCQVV